MHYTLYFAKFKYRKSNTERHSSLLEVYLWNGFIPLRFEQYLPLTGREFKYLASDHSGAQIQNLINFNL